MKPNVTSKAKSSAALLIIDMLNTFDFPQGDRLAKLSLPVAKNIVKLKKRFKAVSAPVIYVNDNFGEWKSNWKQVYQHCAKSSYGGAVAEIMKPEEDDYFVLKPRHSAFYSTSLEVLLEDIHVQNLVITGVAGNICVLFTANDAHMRGYETWVPRDCLASNTVRENKAALKLMEETLKTHVTSSSRLRLSELNAPAS